MMTIPQDGYRLFNPIFEHGTYGFMVLVVAFSEIPSNMIIMVDTSLKEYVLSADPSNISTNFLLPDLVNKNFVSINIHSVYRRV